METKIGKQIVYYRKKNNLSQEELADQLHVTRQAISSWERNINEPDLDSLKEMANIFHISLQELLEKDTIMFDENKQIRIAKQLYLGVFLSFVVSEYRILTTNNITASILIFTFFLMSSTITFTFINAIRSKDFTMIAGYDDSYSYNITTMSKILLTTLFQVLAFHFVINIFIIISFSKQLSFLYFILYLTNFIGAIVFTNKKYQKQLYTNPQDLAKTKKATPLIIFYFLSLAATIIFNVFVPFNIHNIHNNTKEAMLVLLFMTPAIITQIVLLFIGDAKIKKEESIPIQWYVYSSLITVLCIVIALIFPY